MVQKHPMTREGYERLRQEMERLKREERPRMVKALEEARSHGDISENAEYEAAKERQAFVEGRIKDLGAKLAAAEVVDTSQLDSARVTFGSSVALRGADGKELRYRIVGSDEADAFKGTISVLSPLARSLIGKSEGELVKLQAPGGTKQFEILAVNFPWDENGA